MSYLKGKMTVDVLAKVRIESVFEGKTTVTFKGEVECVKHEMYDQYEFGILDVSEYDYDINEVKPIENTEYSIISANGDKREGKSKIIEVIEVFEYDILEEDF